MLTRPNISGASQTAFCVETVIGPDGVLFVDGNGKITAGNGTLESPKPNAFSLVHIADCPQSTPACRASCYVHGLAQAQSDLLKLYQHNSREIRRILNHQWPETGETTTLDLGDNQPWDVAKRIESRLPPPISLSALWAEAMANWISGNCQGGFRWHVSGDVFSTRYARWIADVCRKSPDVNHWIYTRSFKHAGPLVEVSTVRGGNLTLNLSCDKDNAGEAARFSRENGKLRLCYLTTDGRVPPDLPHGSVIFPDYRLRGGNPEGQKWFENLYPEYKAMVCPVDYHGKSETRRCGPCDRCLK